MPSAQHADAADRTPHGEASHLQHGPAPRDLGRVADLPSPGCRVAVRELLPLARGPVRGGHADDLRAGDVPRAPARLTHDVRRVLRHVRPLGSVAPELALQVAAWEEVLPDHGDLRVALERRARRPHRALRRPDVVHVWCLVLVGELGERAFAGARGRPIAHLGRQPALAGAPGAAHARGPQRVVPVLVIRDADRAGRVRDGFPQPPGHRHGRAHAHDFRVVEPPRREPLGELQGLRGAVLIHVQEALKLAGQLPVRVERPRHGGAIASRVRVNVERVGGPGTPHRVGVLEGRSERVGAVGAGVAAPAGDV